MKPLNNRILVRLVEAGEQVKGGIILPKPHNKPQTAEAIVLAVGPKVEDVKVDSRVLIDRYSDASQRVEIAGQLHFIVSEPNVLAILK